MELQNKYYVVLKLEFIPHWQSFQFWFCPVLSLCVGGCALMYEGSQCTGQVNCIEMFVSMCPQDNKFIRKSGEMTLARDAFPALCIYFHVVYQSRRRCDLSG